MAIPQIVIISASVRSGRNSHRVAIYFERFLQENKLAMPEILDLQSFNFPLFEERLAYQSSPSVKARDFAAKVKNADGVIMVTPEYNGGYPASLKNAIDLLAEEWRRKPVALVAVSDGDFGGTQVITSLLFTLWKIRAWVITARFQVPGVEAAFDTKGQPMDKKKTDQRATNFINELLWSVEANRRMAT